MSFARVVTPAILLAHGLSPEMWFPVLEDDRTVRPVVPHYVWIATAEGPQQLWAGHLELRETLA